MNITYDDVGDILYIDFKGDRTELTSSEAGDGILVQLDRESGAVRAIEIWNFCQRTRDGESIGLPFDGSVRPVAEVAR